MRQNMAHGNAQLINNPIQGWGCHARLAAVADINHAFMLQALHGFANGRAANAIARHQGALAWQSITWFEVIRADQGQQAIFDFV